MKTNEQTLSQPIGHRSRRGAHRLIAPALAVVVSCLAAGSALAYDGTKCKAPGNCWEAKPGFPEKIAGSKYDPRHDPKEIEKQQQSIKEMEQRNRLRVDNAAKSGKFVYDLKSDGK